MVMISHDVSHDLVADAVHIVAQTQDQAEAIQATVNLRGFDRIKCFGLAEVEVFYQTHTASSAQQPGQRPDLLIIDPGPNTHTAVHLMERHYQGTSAILLAEAFDEETFLKCFDAGAKDFLIKPINPAYLVSRVLMALSQQRTEEHLGQRDQFLTELGVLSERSGLLTTEYWIKQLKHTSQSLMPHTPISVLMIEFKNLKSLVPQDPTFHHQTIVQIAKQLEQCVRGGDVLGEFFESKFGVILPNTPVEGAVRVAERIVQGLNGATISDQGKAFTLTTHVGVADHQGCQDYEDLINKGLESLKMAQLKETPIQVLS